MYKILRLFPLWKKCKLGEKLKEFQLQKFEGFKQFFEFLALYATFAWLKVNKQKIALRFGIANVQNAIDKNKNQQQFLQRITFENMYCFFTFSTFKSIRLNHARYSIITFPGGIFVL